MPPLTITNTEKGKPKLVYNDFFYLFEEKSKSGEKTYWDCESTEKVEIA